MLFGRENVIAVVSNGGFLRECRSDKNKLLNVRGFTVMLSEGLTFFNKNNVANFYYQENFNETFRVVDFLRIREKTKAKSRTCARPSF